MEKTSGECYFVMTPEEIEREVPYKFIASVRTSPRWDEPDRAKKFATWFSVGERDVAYMNLKKAILWSLVGPPERDTQITPGGLRVWNKLALFCATI